MRAIVASTALLFVGCVHAPPVTTSLLEDFPRAQIPTVEPRAPEPGWCENAQPIGPGIDPDCIGMLVPPENLDALLKEADLLGECRQSLDLSYDGRQSDREYALSLVQAKEKQLQISKEMQPRMFVFGATLGAGVSVLGALLVALAAK